MVFINYVEKLCKMEDILCDLCTIDLTGKNVYIYYSTVQVNNHL